MVGIVVLKDFKSGSYKEMRVVAYNGNSYSDIGKGDFFSCKVDLAKRKISYENLSAKNAPERSMHNVLLVSQKAREFLYQNPHVTAAEYCLNMGECAIRAQSFKVGVYEPVDFKTVFNNGGFYKRILEFKDKTPLWRSVLCESLNYCIQYTFKTSERIFGFSSYGMYINVSALPRSTYKFLDVSKRHGKLARSKNTVVVDLKPKHKDPLECDANITLNTRGRIIYLFSLYKINCINRFVEIFKQASTTKQILKSILDMPSDEHITRLTDDFVKELSDFAKTLFDYGYLEAKSHADVISIREVLLLCISGESEAKISQRVLSRSVNSKLLNKLPCAPYFDSDGTAIWK